jgi:mono/diheme cytochrome c family protein
MVEISAARRATVLLASLACLAAVSCAKQEPAPKAEVDPVKRGEYLVTVLGCNDCHTPGAFYGRPDMTRMLSGSELGWQGTWGTTYARNLTPDQETGLGPWTEDMIVTAIRTGKRPDGTMINPPMPWPDLARLTDDDAYAIAKYLKSIPPVPHQVPSRLGPGVKATGSVIAFPPPSEWDAPKGSAHP